MYKYIGIVISRRTYISATPHFGHSYTKLQVKKETFYIE
jgi:hypothetical protein